MYEKQQSFSVVDKGARMDNAICLNSNTYHGYALDQAIQGARAAGVLYMELSAVRGYTEHVRPDMSDSEIDAILSMLRDNDIQILGMGGHSNIMTADGREEFRANLDLAQRIGAGYVVTGTGDTHDDEDVIEDEAELVEILQGLSADAASRGLAIALETHGNNYGTGVQIAALAEKVGADNFGVNYDTANVIFYGGVQPYDDLALSAGRVIGIHLKDKAGEPREWNFPAIGDGRIDFDRVFSILDESGCAAPLSIEIEFTPAGPASVDEVHAALRRSVDEVRTLLSRHP